MKCEHFCNAHCAFDCPNAAIEAFEERFDIPASDAGYERVKCRECRYYDKYCTCDDCYFKGSEHCPENGGYLHGLYSRLSVRRHCRIPCGLHHRGIGRR